MSITIKQLETLLTSENVKNNFLYPEKNHFVSEKKVVVSQKKTFVPKKKHFCLLYPKKKKAFRTPQKIASHPVASLSPF